MNCNKQSFQDKRKNYMTTRIADENHSNDTNNIDQTIIATKEFKEYIRKKEELYDSFIVFIENSEENDIQNFIDIISQQNQDTTRVKYDEILQLIGSISNNCHRNESFLKNLYQIIDHCKDQIKQTFSNKEIFNIFENNKKMLLFLFQKEIITIDDDIYNELLQKNEANGNRYSHFFYPELKKFKGDKEVKNIKKELIDIDKNIFELFEENRDKGENDSFICSLIREDSVEEFIEHVNRMNISLRSHVSNSIFETNSFLIENNNTTLIEYSAFFGAIKIFQYLRLNDIELEPSLWLYAIHSRNAELIHLLESYQVFPPDNNYVKCMCEAIKCHHNEIADYIENNMITENDEIRKNEEVITTILKNHNYAYLALNFEDSNTFFYLWNYGYHTLVKLFLITRKEYYEKVTLETMNDRNPVKLFLKKCIKKITFNSTNTIVTLQEAANKDQIDIIYYLLYCKKCVPNFCFYKNTVLQKIVIPSSVVSIRNGAFNQCTSLKQIIIPSSVTSIGNCAFSGCSSLTEIEIPSSVTSIGNYAFSVCSSLTEIEIPSSVTSIGNYAFFECYSLRVIVIPSSVTSIGKNAFWGIYSLIIMGSIENILPEMFLRCFSLENITIPSSVISIECYAFSCCLHLKTVTVPFSVILIDDFAFSKCLSLRKIKIPSSVEFIGNYAFFECSSLTQINLPFSVNSIGSYAFCGCKSLEEITIPFSVVSIGDHAFDRCSSLTYIEIPSLIESIGNYVFNECSSLINIEIPPSVISIGNYAFSGCKSLRSIKIPFSVVSIGNYAFNECSSLLQIEIPVSLKSIGNNAFSDCRSLKTIEIPFSVESIGNYAFRGCSSLSKFTIPPSVSSIGNNVFDKCSPSLQKSFKSFLDSREKCI